MEKINKTNKLHILIIVLGIIFISIPAFHSNIWFDESYSVAIVKHSFSNIWNITGNDVHPALYYWLLHIVYLIFGQNILIYRLFSVLAIGILGILGYTHIKKDFGEKVGITFTFLTYFLPIMCTYAQEIRMYSWACLIVTLMAIYAYRFYKNIENNEKNGRIKNLILFGVFSISCCYIHYYALVTTCLVNLLLLIYTIKKRKKDKTALIHFLILSGVQILLYIGWIIYMISQLKHVSGGFWIEVGLINTTVEVLSFQFKRQLDTNFSFNIQTIVSLITSILMYIYIIFKICILKKERKDIKPAILSGGIYIGVIAIILLVSIVMPILYSRYLLVMTGMYIFALAYIISKEKNKIVKFIIAVAIILLGIASNVENVMINYDSSNSEVYNYIKSEIRQDDIIVYSNIGNGGVIAAYFPENEQYFLNFEFWDVEEAYKAYGPGMTTVTDWNFLENIGNKRIWLIDSEYMSLYDIWPKENCEVLKKAYRVDTKYHNYVYNIMLLEKQ